MRGRCLNWRGAKALALHNMGAVIIDLPPGRCIMIRKHVTRYVINKILSGQSLFWLIYKHPIDSPHCLKSCIYLQYIVFKKTYTTVVVWRLLKFVNKPFYTLDSKHIKVIKRELSVAPCPLCGQHIPVWYKHIFRYRDAPRFSTTSHTSKRSQGSLIAQMMNSDWSFHIHYINSECLAGFIHYQMTYLRPLVTVGVRGGGTGGVDGVGFHSYVGNLAIPGT